MRLDPTGGQITAFQLSAVVSQLNCRIRGSGMSAREMLFQRDQFLNTQLPIEDHKLALQQHQRRLANHQSSASSKAPTCTSRDHCPDISIGDLVYLFNDKNKHVSMVQHSEVRRKPATIQLLPCEAVGMLQDCSSHTRTTHGLS